jgi:hypothetical protein
MAKSSFPVAAVVGLRCSPPPAAHVPYIGRVNRSFRCPSTAMPALRHAAIAVAPDASTGRRAQAAGAFMDLAI